MKRSAINEIIKEGLCFLKSCQFHLPPFAAWTAEDWRQKGAECQEIAEAQLGWDITDFGSGDFPRVGLLLFTLRNGHGQQLHEPGAKSYAEKIMMVQEEQLTPTHFHFQKMEDIINRGGGHLLLQLWNATPDEQLASSETRVSCDGILRRIPAGGTVALAPGDSITLPPRLYHKFWGEKGTGPVLVGEVSRVNDDSADNRFYERIGRFPEIEEDEVPFRLLASDYRNYYRQS
jgi:D-lyxose ketol-isomerase